jgi:hypothetical protein
MALKKKNLKRSNKVTHRGKSPTKRPKSLKKKRGGCNPTTVDCLNPYGLSQMGINPYEAPPTVSEQAFDQRYSWSGNGIAGSGIDKHVDCPAKSLVSPSLPVSEEMSGGRKQRPKKKNKRNKNKKSAKKKGGGYYLNLGTSKIGNQALVTGYDDCAPPTLKNQYKLI